MELLGVGVWQFGSLSGKGGAKGVNVGDTNLRIR